MIICAPESESYFIVNGYIPSPNPPMCEESSNGIYENEVSMSRSPEETRAQRAERYQESGLEIPVLGETTFLNIESVGIISIFVFGIYEALFLIKATSQREAYLLANALRGFLTVTEGIPIPEDRSNYYLLELKSKPEPDMTISDLIALVKPIPKTQVIYRDWLERELSSGSVISHTQIQEVCGMIKAGIECPRLLEAVRHLEYSYSLFWGYMNGSYYAAHYSVERTESSNYQPSYLSLLTSGH
jgi:hypothetical protein